MCFSPIFKVMSWLAIHTYQRKTRGWFERGKQEFFQLVHKPIPILIMFLLSWSHYGFMVYNCCWWFIFMKHVHKCDLLLGMKIHLFYWVCHTSSKSPKHFGIFKIYQKNFKTLTT
jgi:hypothetical protein